MKRGIITIDESGNIIMSENVADIWMSEPELVELFGVIAPTLRAAIRSVYKSGVLKDTRCRSMSDWRTAIMPMCSVSRWWSHSLSVSILSVRNKCAMPFLKGCACEKRKQASSFRWYPTIWIHLIIRRKAY